MSRVVARHGGAKKRLTELDDEDQRREDCISAADGVENRRALVLALCIADRVLAQDLGVLARGVHNDDEEIPRNAEVEQEVDVQPDGIRGYERLLAHDHTNEAVRAERKVSGQCRYVCRVVHTRRRI